MKNEHKKKTVRPPKAAKAPKGKAAKKPVKVRQRKQQPKPQPLPGMNVRIPELDKLAYDFAEARDAKNEAIADEDRLSGEVFDAMIRHKVMVWKASGIEFARVPGGEKLRTRKIKEKSERARVDETLPGKAEGKTVAEALGFAEPKTEPTTLTEMGFSDAEDDDAGDDEGDV